MINLLLLILGSVVGSFLNVVIYRLPRGESIVFPPSHCPHCRHKLNTLDLFPVVSYLLLAGRCRYCKETISPIYPFVELLTGFLFLFTYQMFNSSGVLSVGFIIMILCVFIVCFFTDLKYGLIPFKAVLAGLVITLVYLVISFPLDVIFIHLLSGFGAFLLFLTLFLMTKGRGMGFGDVVLVLFMGLFLGFPQIVYALYLAFLTGAIVSLILITLGTKKLHNDTIAFGPFLVTGTFISLFFSNQITEVIKSIMPL